MKKLYALIALLICACCVPALHAQIAAPGQWRIHNTYYEYIDCINVAKDRVYCLPLGQLEFNHPSWSEHTGQLFVIDKETGSITGYNKSNYLSGNVIQTMAYNPDGGYLLIVYTDSNIDLLYDDDTVFPIPGLASSTLSTGKKVNTITFDPANSKAYLATEFGYIVVDDKKKVISESRIYNEPLISVGRVGDRLVAAKKDGVYSSPFSDRHSTIAAFTKETAITNFGKYAQWMLPFDDNSFLYPANNGLWKATYADDGTLTTSNVVYSTTPMRFYYVPGGWTVTASDIAICVGKDGTSKTTDVSSVRKGKTYGTVDGKEFYFFAVGKGFEQFAYDPDTKTWTPGQVFTPNSPNCYRDFYFDYSPNHGMIASNGTYNRYVDMSGMNYEIIANGYKNGDWNPLMYINSTSPFKDAMTEGYEIVVDPTDPDVLFAGTRRHGLVEYNMNDGSAKLYSQPRHSLKSKPGFYAVFPYDDGWGERCTVTGPSFDAAGNMWVGINTGSMNGTPSPLYCWPAADRKAGNVSAFKAVPVPGFDIRQGTTLCLALKHPSNAGKVVFGYSIIYEGPVNLYDGGPSLSDNSDDKSYAFNKFVDQDGNASSFVYTNCYYEDASGRVWVGHSTGVFYFRPSEVTASGTLPIHRIKVARGDGTQLADYLLDGADVTAVREDGAGRLWFSTAGNGVVVTSPDGGTIVEQFTTQNSLLPSDVVYGLGFDPSSNAVYIGTSGPLAVYYCDATTPAEKYDEVLAFPNPVRPEYLGDVTIRGLMDASLMKIVDANGALVKELGTSNGGMAIWDLTDMNGSRVHTGVYYIAASTTSQDSKSGHVGKILVVR